MNAASQSVLTFARHRRNDYDVTNSVQVSSTAAVTQAVCALFQEEWPHESLTAIEHTLETFDALFTGRLPGYNGVDTVYHDRQHSLDVMLAMARLLVGHERGVPEQERLGFARAAMGFVVAAFHDAGYIRETGDPIPNGALYTSSHVSRSARFLEKFMPTIGMAEWIPIATQIVHYSGYEVPFSKIEVSDPRDHRVGHLLGTADLIAQMSDRCYLEKCRDRLYPEFVLAGTATARNEQGVQVRFASGLDLLRQTPNFVDSMMRDRLDGQFGKAYRHLEPLFDGKNPYLEAIQQHMDFLQKVLRTQNWQLLRRNPVCYTYDPNPLPTVRKLMLLHLKDVWSKP